LKTSKQIVKIIGWGFVIAGFIARFTNSSFSGGFFAKGRGWQNSTIGGNALIFFGLVFLVLLNVKKKETDNK
jgi:hypothetical protein